MSILKNKDEKIYYESIAKKMIGREKANAQLKQYYYELTIVLLVRAIAV